MSAIKGIVKVALALIAIGTGTTLGKRGIEDLKSGKTTPNQPK